MVGCAQHPAGNFTSSLLLLLFYWCTELVSCPLLVSADGFTRAARFDRSANAASTFVVAAFAGPKIAHATLLVIYLGAARRDRSDADATLDAPGRTGLPRAQQTRRPRHPERRPHV